MSANIEKDGNTAKVNPSLLHPAGNSTKTSSESKQSPVQETGSAEMAQLLGALQDAFTLEEPSFIEETAEADLDADIELDADLDAQTTLDDATKAMQKQFDAVVKKIAANPSYYLASLCENGKISEDKALTFFKSEVSNLTQRFDEIKAKYSQPATAEPTPVTSEDSDSSNPFSMEHSDTYLALGSSLATLASNVGFIESQMAAESAIQADWSESITDNLTKISNKEMDDIVAECEALKKALKKAKKLGSALKITSYIGMGTGALTMGMMGKPGLGASMLGLGMTGMMGGFTKLAGLMAEGLGKIPGMPPEVANLLADIIVIVAVVVIAAAVTYATGGAAAPEAMEGVAGVAGAETGGAVAGGAVGAEASGVAAGGAAGAEAEAEATILSRLGSILPELSQTTKMLCFVTSIVAPMTNIFGDSATLITEANGGKDAESIQLGCMIGGMTLCAIASLGFGSSLFAGEAAAGEGAAAAGEESSYMAKMSAMMAKIMPEFSSSTRAYLLMGLVSADVTTSIITAVTSCMLGENSKDIAVLTRDLMKNEANMYMYGTISDQVSDLTNSMISANNSEITALSSSLASALRAAVLPLQKVAQILA